MNDAEATAAVAAALAAIAPEVDLATVERDDPLREQLDLDSLDFLSLVQRLHDATGVSIPEDDYSQVGSLGALITYLVRHSAVSTSAT